MVMNALSSEIEGVSVLEERAIRDASPSRAPLMIVPVRKPFDVEVRFLSSKKLLKSAAQE